MSALATAAPGPSLPPRRGARWRLWVSDLCEQAGLTRVEAFVFIRRTEGYAWELILAEARAAAEADRESRVVETDRESPLACLRERAQVLAAYDRACGIMQSRPEVRQVWAEEARAIVQAAAAKPARDPRDPDARGIPAPGCHSGMRSPLVAPRDLAPDPRHAVRVLAAASA